MLFAVLLYMLPTAARSASSFDQAWSDLQALARKEGKVIISIGAVPDYNPIFEAFTKKFGIAVHTQGGSGSARTSRILAEQKSGRYTADIGFLSVSVAARRLEPAGGLVDLGGLLIHPDVIDKSKWYKGQHWYVDQGKTEMIFAFSVRAQNFWQFWYNTEKLTKADISALKSPHDFLQPKWKAMMADQAWSDPGRLGGMTEVYLAPDAGPEWVKKYLTEMDVAFTSDPRLEETWLVRGRNPLKWSEGNIGDALRTLKAKGLPINEVQIPRATATLEARGSECCVNVFKNAPNPKAAQLFVNWFLSKEGQELIHDIDPPRPYTSLREDISPGKTSEVTRRMKGVEYSFRDFDPEYLTNEESARDFILKAFDEGQKKRR